MKVRSECESKLTVTRSRFHAIIFPAGSEEDVQAMLKLRKRKFKKANHHCWAVRYAEPNGEYFERSKDDGEVGHPGKVLLELLRKHDLEGGIMVSRIFGGVKLGVGGVSRAFKEAGEDVIAFYTDEMEETEHE